MIIIVTKKNYEPKVSDCLVLNHEVWLMSDYALKSGDTTYDFDYLIIEDLSLCHDLDKTGILLDEGIPVTNFMMATSLDNIYYGDIETALDDLFNKEE